MYVYSVGSGLFKIFTIHPLQSGVITRPSRPAGATQLEPCHPGPGVHRHFVAGGYPKWMVYWMFIGVYWMIWVYSHFTTCICWGISLMCLWYFHLWMGNMEQTLASSPNLQGLGPKSPHLGFGIPPGGTPGSSQGRSHSSSAGASKCLVGGKTDLGQKKGQIHNVIKMVEMGYNSKMRVLLNFGAVIFYF